MKNMIIVVFMTFALALPNAFAEGESLDSEAQNLSLDEPTSSEAQTESSFGTSETTQVAPQPTHEMETMARETDLQKAQTPEPAQAVPAPKFIDEQDSGPRLSSCGDKHPSAEAKRRHLTCESREKLKRKQLKANREKNRKTKVTHISKSKSKSKSKKTIAHKSQSKKTKRSVASQKSKPLKRLARR